MNSYGTTPPPKPGGSSTLYIIVFFLCVISAMAGYFYFKQTTTATASQKELEALKARSDAQLKELQTKTEQDIKNAASELEKASILEKANIDAAKLKFETQAKAQQEALAAKEAAGAASIQAQQEALKRAQAKIDSDMAAATQAVREATALKSAATQVKADADIKQRQADEAMQNAQNTNDANLRAIAQEKSRIAAEAAAKVADADRRANEALNAARAEAQRVIDLNNRLQAVTANNAQLQTQASQSAQAAQTAQAQAAQATQSAQSARRELEREAQAAQTARVEAAQSAQAARTAQAQLASKVTRARYVRLSSYNEYINIADVAVLNLDNDNKEPYPLAAIINSSPAHPSHPYTNLYDGNINTFGHTAGNGNERITLDYGRDIDMHAIIIVNRRDCCQDRIRRMRVELYNNAEELVKVLPQFTVVARAYIIDPSSKLPSWVTQGISPEFDNPEVAVQAQQSGVPSGSSSSGNNQSPVSITLYQGNPGDSVVLARTSLNANALRLTDRGTITRTINDTPHACSIAVSNVKIHRLLLRYLNSDARTFNNMNIPGPISDSLRDNNNECPTHVELEYSPLV